jgi:hypothetical protein
MKLEPSKNGTWSESLTVEVQAFGGTMQVGIEFDTYTKIVRIQPIENVERIDVVGGSK